MLSSASPLNPPTSASFDHEEFQYLNLIKNILENGQVRSDRTGTGTISLFAPPQLRFSLKDNEFPLLTTKRTFFRPIFEELMWIIRGQTDSKILSNKNVKIWDGNGSKEYLNSVGLAHRREGDLGPVYGFQWRHFGATYVDADTDYQGQGVDQLKQVLEKIVNHPTDRRILMSAWNPSDLHAMALPPCHMFCQFYVQFPKDKESKGILSCQLYQRSCDMGLGVPFNIASYSLLTILLAHVTGLEPGEFIHCMGDAHVYLDHVDALKTQVQRIPKNFPKLKIHSKSNPKTIDEMLNAMESFEMDQIEIIGYEPHPKLVMNMSV